MLSSDGINQMAFCSPHASALHCCILSWLLWDMGESTHCLQGAKISTLTAAVDDRVKALCLWDPVDVTVYAPQSAEYPSAVAALRNVQSNLPVAIVGGGKAGDCVPKNSNYRCLHPMLLCSRLTPSQVSHVVLLCFRSTLCPCWYARLLLAGGNV